MSKYTEHSWLVDNSLSYLPLLFPSAKFYAYQDWVCGVFIKIIAFVELKFWKLMKYVWERERKREFFMQFKLNALVKTR